MSKGVTAKPSKVFDEWLRKNADRIAVAKRSTLLYFLRDNPNFAGISVNEMDIALANRIEANREEYERLLKDSNYSDVQFDPKNSGLMAVHKGHKKNNPKEETYFNGLTDVVKSNSVILYFHDASFYDKQKVENGYAAIGKILSAKGKTNHIQEIICVVSDGSIHHFRY